MSKEEFGRLFFGQNTSERVARWLREAADDIEHFRVEDVILGMISGAPFWVGTRQKRGKHAKAE
jgi:hypothetical protein